MEKTSTGTRDKKLDFLAGYQVLGGMIGLAFMGYLFFSADELSMFFVLLLLLGLVLYLFSFLCGLLLFLRKTGALKLSLVNQLLQVIGFSFLGYAFEYVAGISFDIFIRYDDGLNIGSNFGLSNWHILINGDAGIPQVSVNVIAVCLVFFIRRQIDEQQKEDSVDEISGIGE